MNTNKIKRCCKLEDGTIMEYDACDEQRNGINNPQAYEYLGMGKIYSIEGKLATPGLGNTYFWRRIDRLVNVNLNLNIDLKLRHKQDLPGKYILKQKEAKQYGKQRNK